MNTSEKTWLKGANSVFLYQAFPYTYIHSFKIEQKVRKVISADANTVNSRYLEVVGTIFYKFKLPKVQINLHFG